MLIELKSDQEIVIGVVADSHVPDRVCGLHPDLVDILKQNGVNFIFHAGDISHPRVIEELERIAPVYAIAGNRDFLFGKSLPLSQEFLINGVKTLLTHGHINFLKYWQDKIQHVLHGYVFDRYFQRLQKLKSSASVYIFGHSHHAEDLLIDEKRYFNPGSCAMGESPDYQLSFGLIRYSPDGTVKGEIIPLAGALIRFGRWERER